MSPTPLLAFPLLPPLLPLSRAVLAAVPRPKHGGRQHHLHEIGRLLHVLDRLREALLVVTAGQGRHLDERLDERRVPPDHVADRVGCMQTERQRPELLDALRHADGQLALEEHRILEPNARRRPVAVGVEIAQGHRRRLLPGQGCDARLEDHSRI